VNRYTVRVEEGVFLESLPTTIFGILASQEVKIQPSVWLQNPPKLVNPRHEIGFAVIGKYVHTYDCHK